MTGCLIATQVVWEAPPVCEAVWPEHIVSCLCVCFFTTCLVKVLLFLTECLMAIQRESRQRGAHSHFPRDAGMNACL